MVASGKCLKSIVGVKKPEKDDQDKVSGNKNKKWKLWRSSSGDLSTGWKSAFGIYLRCRTTVEDQGKKGIESLGRSHAAAGSCSWPPSEKTNSCDIEVHAGTCSCSGPCKSRRAHMFVEGQAVQKLLSDCRSKEDMLKQVEEGWCDSQGTLHEIRTKVQMRQEGAVKNFYVNHFVAECLSNKNGAVLD
ncbi:hypothetical protein IFM89_038901 [Coptis chinensis]|uniref:Uncharacterized protein n=1 Tax=Coptis chinensis TaxID=261450 RepID=A0A835J1V0_9MAGN|nr:hypothetical protein IFM89_038901 [Coptis chinensis]